MRAVWRAKFSLPCRARSESALLTSTCPPEPTDEAAAAEPPLEVLEDPETKLVQVPVEPEWHSRCVSYQAEGEEEVCYLRYGADPTHGALPPPCTFLAVHC